MWCVTALADPSRHHLSSVARGGDCAWHQGPDLLGTYPNVLVPPVSERRRVRENDDIPAAHGVIVCRCR
jgi:hypothetical protein